MKDEARRYVEIVREQLEMYSDSIDYKAISDAATLILDAQSRSGRVHVTGIGKPSYVAGYIASLLSSTGTPAYTLHGTEAVHGSSGQVVAGDVVIAISNSGETLELKSTVQTVLNNEAKVIAVTKSKTSWLSEHAHVCLIAGVDQEGDTMNKPPRGSILAELLVLQALSVYLQEVKQLTPQQYVKWHPGGALGASITKGEIK